MKDVKKAMQKHALYVHLLLLTQKSLISRLLRAVISNKPLQAHLNKGLDQPEELQFINLSCFCLCPSMLSLLAPPEPLVLLSPLAQLTGVLVGVHCAQLHFPLQNVNLPFPFLPGFLSCIIILAGPFVLEICLPHVSWSSSAKILG